MQHPLERIVVLQKRGKGLFMTEQDELNFRLHFEMNGTSKNILDDEQMTEILNWFKKYEKTKINHKELDELLMWVTGILDGWHADGTAWSKWDESIRQKVTEFRKKYTYGK